MLVVLGLGVVYLGLGIGLWTPVSMGTRRSNPVVSAAFHDAFTVCMVIGFLALLAAGIVLAVT